MFGLSKHARMKRRLTKRLRYAYLLDEDLGLQRELQRNLRLAQEAVAMSKDDETTYERPFGQPPPDLLRRALRAELLLWLTVRDALASLARRDVLPDGYRKEVQLLKPRVDDLLSLATLARTVFRRSLGPGEQRDLTTVLRRLEAR